MRRVLADLAAGSNFDVVHADQANMGQYALLFENSRRVLDLHNALWMLYKRLAETSASTDPMKYILMRDWPLLKRYEGELCHQFDAITAVTEEDRQLLIEAGAPDTIGVIPVAIDTDEQAPITRRPAGPHIVHIGTMYWQPNINGIHWFLESVYPLIKLQVPDVRCTLIGSRPPDSIIQRSNHDRTLTVTGYIEDPQPFLEDASMMIIPLQAGGGMRVKILNALSQGIPMVSTSVGCEGIRVTDEKDILIADEAGDFARACVRMLTDYKLNEEISTEGRRTAEQYYDYRQACRPLDEIYTAQKA
jgi:glycosyltransferase involved in cell wall biosynthesis